MECSIRMKTKYISSALVIVLAYVIRSAVQDAERTEAPSNSANALWVQSLYFRGTQPTTLEPLKREDLVKLCKTFNKNHIRYAYMFAGPYDTNGTLPEYAFSDTARSSVDFIRARCPNLEILPWVGGVVNKTVFLNDPVWCSNAVKSTSRLLSRLKLSGVHVNFEFFTYEIKDEYYPGQNNIDRFGQDELDFFRSLRRELPNSFLSTVAVTTSTNAFHWKRKNTFQEIQILGTIVNQISFLCFDTSIQDNASFRSCLSQQLSDIRSWKSNSGRAVQYLIGVGTFINKPDLWKFRNLEIESITNTLNVLRDLLSPPNQNDISGLAIFADWTTEDEEWRELRELWLGDL